MAIYNVFLADFRLFFSLFSVQSICQHSILSIAFSWQEPVLPHLLQLETVSEF